jgi:hypothetical protein
MTWKRKILVVANVTATSDRLLEEMRACAAREPTAFTLIVPATAPGGRTTAQETLTRATERFNEAGLEVDGSAGDVDPIIAVTEAWDPTRYDEIMISTLPSSLSRWLQADLPHRVEKLTGAPVKHIVSPPPQPAHHTVAAKPHEKQSVMSPLSVLTWGGAGHGTHPAR